MMPGRRRWLVLGALATAALVLVGNLPTAEPNLAVPAAARDPARRLDEVAPLGEPVEATVAAATFELTPLDSSFSLDFDVPRSTALLVEVTFARGASFGFTLQGPGDCQERFVGPGVAQGERLLVDCGPREGRTTLVLSHDAGALGGSVQVTAHVCPSQWTCGGLMGEPGGEHPAAPPEAADTRGQTLNSGA